MVFLCFQQSPFWFLTPKICFAWFELYINKIMSYVCLYVWHHSNNMLWDSPNLCAVEIIYSHCSTIPLYKKQLFIFSIADGLWIVSSLGLKWVERFCFMKLNSDSLLLSESILPGYLFFFFQSIHVNGEKNKQGWNLQGSLFILL